MERIWDLLDLGVSGFKYNLQVFPDTISAAALLFALMFQSPAFAGFFASTLLLNVLHPVIAGFFSQVFNGTISAGDTERCTGRFPGASYERLIGAVSGSSFGQLDEAHWPSYYSTYLGFIVAYMGLLPIVYNAEIEASPKKKAAAAGGLVALGVLVFLCGAYRALSSCDTIGGILIGVGAGAFIGAACLIFLAWISDRRITNILNLPLLRNRMKDGKPIYVCDRG